jgi:hypothetical protein
MPSSAPPTTPALDLEHDVELQAPVEQLRGQAQVLIEREGGAVEHVRVEEWALATLDPFGGVRKQRPQERVHVRRRTVVGVQRDGHRVALRQLAGERCERARARQGILRRTREIASSADRDLHYAVRAGFRKPAHRGVERLRRRDIDRRQRVASVGGAVEHRQVLVRARQHRRIIARDFDGCTRPRVMRAIGAARRLPVS